MRIILPLLMTTLLLSGCAMIPDQRVALLSSSTEIEKLFRIDISANGKPRYSGLVGLKAIYQGLAFIMLDSSGIKLIEAQVDIHGSHMTKFVIPQLADSRLPKLIGQALKRTYLDFPNHSPCATHVLNRFCLIEEAGTWIKSEQRGIVSVWLARYQKRPVPFFLQEARYTHRLFGLEINFLNP